MFVADRNHDAVHPVARALRDQLCENCCHSRAFGRTADVIFTRRRRWRVDHELLCRWLVGRRGLQRLHVATVSRLGHRKAAKQVKSDQRPNVRFVVAFGAEILDGPAEQAPQHTCLDHQGHVRHSRHLDLDHRRSDVTGAAVLLLEAVLGRTCGGDDLQLLVDPTAGDHRGGGEVWTEDLHREFGADRVFDVSPAAVEGVL